MNAPFPENSVYHGSGWPREAPRFTSPGQTLTAATDPTLLEPLRGVEPASLGDWIERLNRSGVSVDRRTSPHLQHQLEMCLKRPIDTVIVSILDVDPAACLNTTVAARYPLELAAGALVLGRLTGARRVLLVLDARLPWNWIATLRKIATQTKLRIEPLVNDYPQADPTLMLYTVLSRRLRPGRLPTEQGALLLDASAAMLIGRIALGAEETPATPVVVRDHSLLRSSFALSPREFSIGDLLSALGVWSETRVIRVGDLLRDEQVGAGYGIGSAENVIHVAARVVEPAPNACIRCGWCVEACPTNVHPATVLEAAQRRDTLLAERGGVEACIECGVCTYVCPSRLPILAGIRTIKKQMAAELNPGATIP